MTTTRSKTKTKVWLDCETTSLGPDRRPWEIAAIVRKPGEPDVEYQWFVDLAALDLYNADPVALNVGGFWKRHPQAGKVPLLGNLAATVMLGGLTTPPPAPTHHEIELLPLIAELTNGRAIICGSKPSFDQQVLETRMAVHGITPTWYHHPKDIPMVAYGWLLARGMAEPPEKSDQIALACGIDPALYPRHTALGDCRLFRDLSDLIEPRTDLAPGVPA